MSLKRMLKMNLEENYLLDKKVRIYQPDKGYHASSDAVWLSAAVETIKKGDNILDVGSGTGAVSLCLAERFKNYSISITGLEIQELLATSSNHSAQENGFDFISFINTDIFKSKLKPCSFAHVISNPPYSLNDMPSPNESKAFAHNFQTCNLQNWIDFCVRMLKPQGCFYMINRTEALDDILFFIHGRLGGIEVFPLHSKKELPAKRIIVRAKKDSKKPLVIHPGIVVHNSDGIYTSKAEQVLRKGSSI